jgi:hypothetical protein
MVGAAVLRRSYCDGGIRGAPNLYDNVSETQLGRIGAEERWSGRLAAEDNSARTIALVATALGQDGGRRAGGQRAAAWSPQWCSELSRRFALYAWMA